MPALKSCVVRKEFNPALKLSWLISADQRSQTKPISIWNANLR
jgi:hypothetical protein